MRSEQVVSFYETFFQKRTFLSPASIPEYNSPLFLKGQGLDNPDLYRDRNVLEIGAGCGRVTQLLASTGLIGLASSYVILEPTSAIDVLHQQTDLPNMAFHQASAKELGQFFPEGNFDTIICTVFPHLPGPTLSAVIGEVARFLKPGGSLMINAFYNGESLAWGHRIRRITTHRPHVARLAAFAQVALQYISYGIGVDWLKPLYHRHFPYSFQRTHGKMLEQCREFFSVDIYNIGVSYGKYITALQCAGLSPAEFYPTSLSLRAVKGPSTAQLQGLRPDASVAIVGRDWRARNVARRLGLASTCLKAMPEEAFGFDQVILAYDYTRGPSYVLTAQLFLDRGYRLGETLFIYQMLLES